MNHATTVTKLLRRASWWVTGALLFTLCLPAPMIGAESLDNIGKPPAFLVSCTDLTATASPDNRFYTFVATAGGSATAITGYRFDYGDRQSYTVTLRPDATRDRLTAKVTHTYEKFGTYQARVHVLYGADGKTATATSPECQATITYGPPISTLPKTGASTAIFALPLTLVVVAATAAWHIRLRRKIALDYAHSTKHKTP